MGTGSFVAFAFQTLSPQQASHNVCALPVAALDHLFQGARPVCCRRLLSSGLVTQMRCCQDESYASKREITAGAGACALPMALHHHFPKATIDAVEIDAEALDMAHCFFGAEEDAHLLLHHEDGVKFLTRPGVASKVGLQASSALQLCKPEDLSLARLMSMCTYP